jgi:hypothetical protein
MKFPRPPPALLLFLLSPIIGELLSGSSPPVEFFNPFGFALIAALYGSGAVIVRELKVRWKRGIGSVLLLGAAYGILEEGLMVCSFFNPGWMDLRTFATYGRWLDVNWVWAVMLTIYHSVYSITVPIVLIELTYPERKRERWLSNKVLVAVSVLLASDVILGFLLFAFLSGYWPPLPQYSLAALTAMLFCYAAYRLPDKWGTNGKRLLPKPLIMWAIGAIGTFVFFLGFYLMHILMPLWQIGILFGPGLVLSYSKLLKGFEWKETNRKHSFALVSGALTYFIILAPLQEIDKTRTDNPIGMSVVGLAFLVGLVWLGRRIWRPST